MSITGSNETQHPSATFSTLRPRIDVALECVENGYAVFPCSQDKTPRTPNGFKDGTESISKVQEWWKKWPDALVGIWPKEGVVVLDFDTDTTKGLDASTIQAGAEELLLKKFPTTYTAFTRRGGWHKYYRTSEHISLGQAILGIKGFDLRGSGGYAIVHGDITPPHPDDLAELPQSMAIRFATVVHIRKESSLTSEEASAIVTTPGARNKFDVLCSRLKEVPLGERHGELVRNGRLAGGWIGAKQLNPQEAEKGLLDVLSFWGDAEGQVQTVYDALEHGATEPLEADPGYSIRDWLKPAEAEVVVDGVDVKSPGHLAWLEAKARVKECASAVSELEKGMERARLIVSKTNELRTKIAAAIRDVKAVEARTRNSDPTRRPLSPAEVSADAGVIIARERLIAAQTHLEKVKTEAKYAVELKDSNVVSLSLVQAKALIEQEKQNVIMAERLAQEVANTPALAVAQAVLDSLQADADILEEAKIHISAFKVAEEKLEKAKREANAARTEAGELRLNNEGRPENTFFNVNRVLATEFADTYWQNAYGNVPMVGPRRLEPEDYGNLREYLGEKHDLHPHSSIVHEAIAHRAASNKRNPVSDYLKGIVWDGTERLKSLAENGFCGDLGDPITNAYANKLLRKWVISAVARALNPGCKADCMIVLVGDGRIGKSTSVKALVGKGWFNDNPIPADEKRSIMVVPCYWVHEMSEMKNARDIEQLKAFLSSACDVGVRMRGDLVETVDRRCVFFGTTNNEECLVDPTGNGRFWTIRSLAPNPAWLEENRDQLWAEAVAAYNSGEPWHMDKTELPELHSRNMEFTETKIVEQALTIMLLQEVSGATWSALKLWQELHSRNDAIGTVTAKEIGMTMRKLGWTKYRNNGIWWKKP